MLRYRIATTLMIVALGLQEVVATGLSYTAEEGPYEVNIKNISTCGKKQSWVRANITTYTSNGHQLLRGTFSVQQKLKNLKYFLQVYYIDPSAGKVKVFEIKNQDCRNFVVRLILQAIKTRYDERRCSAEPESSEFTGLDVNKIFHSVVQTMFYGSGQLRFVISIPAGKIFCLDINLQVLKLHANAKSTP